MTGLVRLSRLGYPVIFDATHSVQKPGGNGTSSGGNRDFVAPLMNAALTVGVDAIFAEIHPDPDHAISDAANQLKLKNAEDILQRAAEFDQLARQKNKF